MAFCVALVCNLGLIVCCFTFVWVYLFALDCCCSFVWLWTVFALLWFCVGAVTCCLVSVVVVFTCFGLFCVLLIVRFDNCLFCWFSGIGFDWWLFVWLCLLVLDCLFYLFVVFGCLLLSVGCGCVILWWFISVVVFSVIVDVDCVVVCGCWLW